MNDKDAIFDFLRDRGYTSKLVNPNHVKIWLDEDRCWLNYYFSSEAFHKDGQAIIGHSKDSLFTYLSAMSPIPLDEDEAVVVDLDNILMSIEELVLKQREVSVRIEKVADQLRNLKKREGGA